MWKLVKFYWGLCTFQKGPEDAPAYPVFLIVIATLFFIFNVFTQSVFDQRSLKASIVMTLSVMFFLMVGVWALLWLKGFTYRLIATLGALLGQDLFIELLFTPFHYLFPVIEDHSGFLWSIMLLLYLLSLCWDLAIKGHILQRALNIGPVLGMGLAITLVISAILFSHHVSIYSRIVVS